MGKENFKKLDDDIIDFFKERLNESYIPGLKFIFLSNNKQKSLIKLVKIPDTYSYLLNKDILVIVNDEYFRYLDKNADDMNAVLFDNAINSIEVNIEKGTFKISKGNINTNDAVINKYGYEKIKKAIEIEKNLQFLKHRYVEQ